MALFFLAVAVGLGVTYSHGLQSRREASEKLSDDVRRSGAKPRSVDVVRLAEASADAVLVLPGEARPYCETTIFARTNGYLKKWCVDIGDHVKSGESLASIETPELDDQVVAAKAKSDMLKAEVHVAESAVNFAKLSFDRWEAAAPEGAVSHQERDQKKAELDSSVARLDAAKKQVAVSDAEVLRLNTLVGFKSVTAPFDGVITRRHVDVGALVTAGSTTNTTPLFTIVQSTQIRVNVDVPQVAVPEVKVGMPAVATAREFPGQKFVGRVDRRSESIDPGSKTLRVEVLVPNPSLTLLPGMYVQVSFKTVRASPPVRIPSGALCFRSSGPQVAVVSPDHRVKFRNVDIVRDLGDFVEVASVVHPDDLVGLNIGNGVNDGDLVDPHEIVIGAPRAQPAAARTGTLKAGSEPSSDRPQ